MPGALPADVVGPRQFPKVFAWIERFQHAVDEAAHKASAEVKSVTGEEAARVILGASFVEDTVDVDEEDPVAIAGSLKKGVQVRLWPSDTGSLHKDLGVLVGFTRSETVIETRGGDGEVLVRLHAPRHGFRVRKVTEDGASSGLKL